MPCYLDEVLGKVSSLPNDLKQTFSKIRELDARCVGMFVMCCRDKFTTKLVKRYKRKQIG